jgi:hypothetical protein
MRAQTLSLLSLLLVLGCSSSSSPSGSTRAVIGTVSAQSYRLDNPVVLAESSDARVFVATVAGDGSFALALPAGVAYRLTLANSTATTNAYAAVARINWPLVDGPARWAVLGAGDTLNLGSVYRRGSTPAGQHISSYSGGNSDGGAGSCKEDDDAKCGHEHEDDCDSDHQHADSDHCDKDDDSDKHDHDCDHEHGYGDVDGGMSCSCGDHDGHHDDDDDRYGSGGEHGGAHACDGGVPAKPTCSCGGGGQSGGGGTVPGKGNGGGGGAVGAPCSVNSDCASGACIQSVCSQPTSQIP